MDYRIFIVSKEDFDAWYNGESYFCMRDRDFYGEDLVEKVFSIFPNSKRSDVVEENWETFPITYEEYKKYVCSVFDVFISFEETPNGESIVVFGYVM